MSIASTECVHTLLDKNRTKVCAYCGNKLRVIHKEDKTGSVYEWEKWVEYECTCKSWKKYEELNTRLIQANTEFKTQYENYMEKRKNILAEYDSAIIADSPKWSIIEKFEVAARIRR